MGADPQQHIHFGQRKILMKIINILRVSDLIRKVVISFSKTENVHYVKAISYTVTILAIKAFAIQKEKTKRHEESLRISTEILNFSFYSSRFKYCFQNRFWSPVKKFTIYGTF